MRTQAIAIVVAAPLLALGIPQAAAYTTPYYDGGITRPILSIARQLATESAQTHDAAVQVSSASHEMADGASRHLPT